MIDAFVLGTACATLRPWQDDPALAASRSSPSTSPPNQLSRTEFLATVDETLGEPAPSRTLLTLELTEHVMLDDVVAVGAGHGAGSRASASSSRSTISAPAIRR